MAGKGCEPTTLCSESADRLAVLGEGRHAQRDATAALEYVWRMGFELPTGQTLAVDQHGAAEAPTVVLLHGLSGNRRGYGVLIDHLAGHIERGEMQVLNVDLRGHGQSSRATLANYDATSYAADIAALIDSLTDGGAIVVGHSLGGLVAAALASTWPDLVRALFLEDPPLFEGDAVRRNASPVAAFFPVLVAAVRDLNAQGAPLSDYEALALTHVAPDEAAARGYSLSQWDPTCMQAAIDGIAWHGFNPTASFSCPVTILRADPTCGAVFAPSDVAPVQSANPHAQISMVPAAAHGILSTQPAAYLHHFDTCLGAVL
jgi:pimeloyl-ACP methyl ester carboxylesterase